MQFVSASSFVQPSFWNKLTELKINVDKLDDKAREIWGHFSILSGTWPNPVVEVDSTSFNNEFEKHKHSIPFHGKVFNKNTIEEFKECDKNELISAEGQLLLDNIKSGAALEKPSLLNIFFILSFSDFKKYHFYYWFAFPVPYNLEVELKETRPFPSDFDESQLNSQYLALDHHQKCYFLIHDNQVHTLSSRLREINQDNHEEYYFAFTDHNFGENNPKSQLKNYIAFILNYCPFLASKDVKFLLFSLDKRLSCSQSQVYLINLSDVNFNKISEQEWAGWEKNEKNKFVPRFSNMKSTMDPKVLFEESVDLNLKLMKWRLLPDIDLESIKNLKCLLLGAGTLGCSVARTLLGWGVRNITFVDNSTVSFSNPVRQSLFTYEDSTKGRFKAEAAADNLRKIFPGIKSHGIQLTIPMPGHTLGPTTLKNAKISVERLEALTQDHDVIFLLTDSRESRWLPTLLGTFYDKIIINCALGFDSYLIMRYGGKSGESSKPMEVPEGFKAIQGNQLGCYFCNDVTAPGNSLKDRTLDQQCTVTRPGVSAIAGALAVELAISLSQHESKVKAPAFYQFGSNVEGVCEDQTILGILPHSIRGFLSNFTHVLPATPRYDLCIACSDIVLEEYRKSGFEFLKEVFNSSKYLEDLTGLTDLQSEDNYADVLEMGDEDDWE